ncbi:hypothetical protein [Alkalitalea saponilacus]|uniref:Outer membrane protein beta-barrel domain-containing protein n=1 Tax=Alkalitalea saponilacus TaxID=889453 RepID=A0A1T5CD44_9BACT|nr:hypothetical protein [Alkalitalea saponilacus]ASB49821.1 hypothetical protein CDL62_12090 [Alkalitalea saponilacus]SKB57339.1 hypothetical protein SAMN03080601_00771 [Alkalitalea saponilacus]
MKKILIILVSFMMTSFPAMLEGQSSEGKSSGGLALFFGPSVTYFHGEHSDEFDSFDADRLNWQMNIFFGFYTGEDGSSHAFGAFGAAGYTNRFTLNEMAGFSGLDMNNVIESRFNSFYQIEGGLLLANILRLSTGLGKQYYTTSGGDNSFNYLSTTAGFLINMGTVSWSLDANFNYGRDYSDTILKLSTGIVFVF